MSSYFLNNSSLSFLSSQKGQSDRRIHTFYRNSRQYYFGLYLSEGTCQEKLIRLRKQHRKLLIPLSLLGGSAKIPRWVRDLS